MLSYLPLAHVVERVLVEHGWLRTGMQVFFADSLDTFAADLQRARPTIFFSVPRLWVKFQQGVHHKMPQAKLNLLLSIPILSGIVRRKLLKALGLGIDTDPDPFELGPPDEPPRLVRWSAPGPRPTVHLTDLAPATDHLAAVATIGRRRLTVDAGPVAFRRR